MKDFLRKVIVIALVFCMCFPALTAHAQEGVDFSTSGYSDQNILIHFEGANIMFLKFPKEEEFRYVSISLYGEDGNVLNKATYSTSEAVVFSTADIPDGTYYIQVYRAAERYSTFWSYMYREKGIQIAVQNGVASPLNSPVYQNNINLLNKRRSDDIALQYYRTPSWGVESGDKKIVDLAKSIVLESDSEYDKLKKVHDWAAANVWYDYDAYYSGKASSTNALGVLETKKSVCQGYANLTAALLRALGIPARVISGYALGVSTNGKWNDSILTDETTNHAWNEAYVDGKWIILDTTWDSNNKFEKGVFSSDTGVYSYRYFDPTIEMFSYDHKIFSDDSEIVDYEAALDCFYLPYKKLTLYQNGTKNSTMQLTVKIDERVIDWDWEISYFSSDPSVATVNRKGLIEAKKPGKAIITATAKIGYATKTMETSVTVEKPRVNFTKSVKKMKKGSTASFRVKLYGLQSVKWFSSDPNVLSVDKAGNVTALKAGTATVTVQSGVYKKSAKVVVTAR